MSEAEGRAERTTGGGEGIDRSAIPAEDGTARSVSRLYRFGADFTWEGVPIARYKPEDEDWSGVIRQILIGYREATAFHVRYFEIAPGGYSTLEKHGHAHAVIALRGEGVAVVRDRRYRLRFLDTLYVAPWTPHQFLNLAAEPFGFLCIVDATRDRPQPLDESELEAVAASPETGPIARSRQARLRREPPA